jgi:arylsulfatase A-like enzyme/lipoprotein NlpI
VGRLLVAVALLALAVAGVALGLCGCGVPVWRGAEAPRHLLVITLDTTRADHLSVYGGRADVPNLERLAREGVAFESAFAPAPLTLPAHVSLFTGLYPAAHGVRNNGGFRLGDEAVTLAEILRQQGFRTAAVIGSQILDSRYGLDQGFEVYDDSLPPEETVRTFSVERPAADVVDRALSWLQELAGRPQVKLGEEPQEEARAEPRAEPRAERWFLWIHLFDPHFEYQPPEPHRTRYADAPYDGEIAYADEQAGRVLEWLRERGELDRTLVVVAGDHGESLGEHGEAMHGVFVYDSTMRVPLLIRHPPGLGQGVRVTPLVRLVDVLPTVLELLGVPRPEVALHGDTLLPLIDGRRTRPRAALLESWLPRLNYAWSELVAVRDERWKYIRAPRPELYDLAADPPEARNLAGRELVRGEEYRVALDRLEEEVRPAGGRDLARAQAMDAEMRESLASLGYISLTGSEAAQEAALPDPKDKIGEYEEMARALQALRGGRQREALPLIERSVAANPRSAFLHRWLGNAYRGVGRLREAIESLKRALELDPASFGTLTDLGVAYFDVGELDRAEEVFHQVLRINPHIAVAYSNLALVELKRGRREAAARLYERSLEEDPNLLRSLVNLGTLHEEAGRVAEAIPLYLRAVELDPGNEKAFFSAGYLLFRAGRYDEALEILERAQEAHPKSARPRLYKAQVHQKRGDRVSAEREARAALALEPSSAEARRILAALEARRRRGGS